MDVLWAMELTRPSTVSSKSFSAVLANNRHVTDDVREFVCRILSYIVENQVTMYRTSNRTNYIFNRYLEDTGYAPKYGSIIYLGCRLVFSQDLITLRSEEWPVSTRKPLRVFKLKQHTLVPAILHGYQAPNKFKNSDFPHKNDERKKICKKPKAQMQALTAAANMLAAKESV